MSLLFKPFDFSKNNLTLENRIIIAPMCTYSAKDGIANDFHFQHWSNMLLSGAGLFIIEATAVNPAGRISAACLGIWDDITAGAIKTQLNKARKISNTPVAIQLAHAGRKASTPVPWETVSREEWQVVAPSAVAYSETYPNPNEISIAEIKTTIQEFVQAALRAQDIGIDLVEIHAAHGYLIHQFLSPLANKRTDEYGGSLENRMRLLTEIMQAMNNETKLTIPFGVRISATDWVDGGFNLNEAIEVAKKIKELNGTYLHVSTAGLSEHQKIEIGPLYQVPHARAIKNAVPDLPIIAVGLITEPKEAEEILAKEEADFIGIARAILFNPRWPWLAAKELGGQVRCPPQYVRCAPRGHHDLFKSETSSQVSVANSIDPLNR